MRKSTGVMDILATAFGYEKKSEEEIAEIKRQDAEKKITKEKVINVVDKDRRFLNMPFGMAMIMVAIAYGVAFYILGLIGCGLLTFFGLSYILKYYSKKEVKKESKESEATQDNDN